MARAPPSRRKKAGLFQRRVNSQTVGRDEAVERNVSDPTDFAGFDEAVAIGVRKIIGDGVARCASGNATAAHSDIMNSEINEGVGFFDFAPADEVGHDSVMKKAEIRGAHATSVDEGAVGRLIVIAKGTAQPRDVGPDVSDLKGRIGRPMDVSVAADGAIEGG